MKWKDRDPYIAERRAWNAMKQRCYNSRATGFKHYGGRGIVVCSEWRDSFKTFLSNMGLKPSSEYSLDRIDCNGNYEPSNCRWTTRREQNVNQRHILKLHGTDCLGKFYEFAGISRAAVWKRMRQGMSREEAVLSPKRHLIGNGKSAPRPVIYNKIYFESVSAAARAFNVDPHKIRRHCEYV